MKIYVIAAVLCLLGAAGTVIALQGGAKPASRAVDADFARGVDAAEAAYASGKGGWYFHYYSNMPNGPDDPVLVQERDLFVEVLKEKGIEPLSTNSGCIPVPGLLRFGEGYNSIADTLLKEKFGANYMTLLKQEVARRMKPVR